LWFVSAWAQLPVNGIDTVAMPTDASIWLIYRRLGIVTLIDFEYLQGSSPIANVR